ncbi:MAG: hypothetical protein NTX25_11055 [Proteobacteria bacterium]|nr:hypothetical protein [Pseudomonadota bacterium]
MIVNSMLNPALENFAALGWELMRGSSLFHPIEIPISRCLVWATGRWRELESRPWTRDPNSIYKPNLKAASVAMTERVLFLLEAIVFIRITAAKHSR